MTVGEVRIVLFFTSMMIDSSRLGIVRERALDIFFYTFSPTVKNDVAISWGSEMRTLLKIVYGMDMDVPPLLVDLRVEIFGVPVP